MKEFVIKEISGNNIEFELESIGFDSAYKYKASDKFRYKNLKIYDLTVAQANILKQTALIFGADCAVNRDVVTGKAEKNNVILCGSWSQLKKIAQKLKNQPFKLGVLAENILSFLVNKNRSTKLAGILNITPDSFSDGGKYFEPEAAIKKLLSLIEDGADIVDIGAESTKPGSNAVEAEEQIRRLKPVLDFIQKENIKTPISIDTRSATVADYALNNGATIINDVSGFDFDPELPEVVANYSATVILQHSQGTPDIMQDSPSYTNLIEEVYFSLKSKIELAKAIGIENIIIDPGLGFGKTGAHNFEILDRIQEFHSLGYPVILGVSRKSFLDVSNESDEVKDALTLAVSYPLIKSGVDYLRVHNLRLHRKLLKLIDFNYTQPGNLY